MSLLAIHSNKITNYLVKYATYSVFSVGVIGLAIFLIAEMMDTESVFRDDSSSVISPNNMF